MFTQQNKEIFDDLYEGVVMVDKYRNIVYWNKSAQRILGYEREQVIEKKTKDGYLLHYNNKGVAVKDCDCPLNVAMNQREYSKGDYLVKNKTGKVVPIEVKAFPIINKGNYVVGAVELFKNKNEVILSLEELNNLKMLNSVDDETKFIKRTHLKSTFNGVLTQIDEDNMAGAIMIELSNLYESHKKYKKDIKRRMILQAASAVKRNTNEDSIKFRFDEEKFLIILKNTKPVLINMVKEKLITAIENALIRNGMSILKIRACGASLMLSKTDKIDDVLRNLETKILRKSAM
ncbi:PAS domain-containing protein [Peptostreptococcaceae bacterium AGR-M142]